jgi:hypothetical protein
MDTWAILAAAHATLTSGFNGVPIPVIGAASMNSFTFGAGLAVLTFAATRVSRQLDPLRRPAVVQLAARWGRACQRRVQRLCGIAPAGKARIRKRVNVTISRVLADQADEQQPVREPVPPSADGIFWPQKRSSDTPSSGYQSKHRLPGSAKSPQRARRAPRHAAPPARSSAR